MEKEVVIKIEGENWSSALDKAFKKLNKTAKIDGFRPGKAPKEVFIKKYGMSSLYMEAAEACLDQAYEEMIEQNKEVQIVAQPDISVSAVTDDYVEFKFVLTLKPEVELGKYTGLKVKKEQVKVTEEEVTEALNAMRERYIENIDKDGEVVSGDVAIIDFEGFKDGVAFDGGKGENYSLKIGSNTFIPGFEEQVIGMKPEEEKEIKVVFPEDYGVETLKGAPAVFKVKLHEIKVKKTRELDEEFFEDLAMEGVDSKEKLEKEIEKEIKAQKEMDNENKYVDQLLEEVAKNVEVDIPQEMVDEEADRLLKNFEQQMAMQGISLDIYYQFTGSSEKDLREQLDKEAYNNVLYRLMLEEIMNLEKVEVSEEEALKEAEELSKKYKMEKEEFLKQLGGIEMIQYDLEMRKVVELLKEANK